MATTAIRFGKTAILIGDGASPENFVAPCVLETLEMAVTINKNDTALPDCEDPDAIAWLVSDIVSQQMVLSGNGLLAAESVLLWQGWYLDNAGAEKNVWWRRNLAAPQGGGYFQAPAILTTYRETGQRGQRWQANIAITLNGKPVFTPAP